MCVAAVDSRFNTRDDCVLQLSLADIYVYDLQDNLLQLKEDALKDYPLMQKLRSNVEAHPKLKVYLANRKKTIF